MNRKPSKKVKKDDTQVDVPIKPYNCSGSPYNYAFGLELKDFSKNDGISSLNSPQSNFNNTFPDPASNSETHLKRVDDIIHSFFTLSNPELFARKKPQQLDQSLGIKWNQSLPKENIATDAKTVSYETQEIDFNKNDSTETLEFIEPVFEERIEAEPSNPGDPIRNNLSRVNPLGETFVPMVDLSSSIRTGLLKYISILHHRKINEADTVIYTEDTSNLPKRHFCIRLDIFRKGKLIATVKSPRLNKTTMFTNVEKNLLDFITRKKYLNKEVGIKDLRLFEKLREINKCGRIQYLKKKIKESEWLKVEHTDQDIVKYIENFAFTEFLDKYFLGGFLVNKIKKLRKFYTEDLGSLLASDPKILKGVSELKFHQALEGYLKKAKLELSYEEKKQFIDQLYESLSRGFENSFSRQDLSSQITEIADLILQDMSLSQDIYKAIYMLANRAEAYKKLKQLAVTRLVVLTM